MASRSARISRLDPKVNRILYVRNLPYKITATELYDLFGRYGAIRQIRVGNSTETRGMAFVVYEDIFDAKTACEHLTGFNVGGRYLTLLYYQPKRAVPVDTSRLSGEVDALRQEVGANEAAEKKAAAAAATAMGAGAGGGGASSGSSDYNDSEADTDGCGALDEDEQDRRLMRVR